MPPEGCEPTIPASELPQTQALERAATGIGNQSAYIAKTKWKKTNYDEVKAGTQ
jgi:hypothetical protein